MSTIKTTYLQHPSASAPSLTLSSSGAMVMNGSMVGAGLDHIVTATISSGSDMYFENVFSSQYYNYLLVGNLSGSSNSSNGLWGRLRTSSTDSTTNYSSLCFFPNATSYREAITNAFMMGVVGTGSRQAISTTICGPYIANATSITGTNNGTSADFRNAFFGGQQSDSTQFESFHLFSQAGQTWTGAVSIYGYKNS